MADRRDVELLLLQLMLMAVMLKPMFIRYLATVSATENKVVLL